METKKRKPATTGDWAALPDDALLAIFGRLGHADIFLGAELTCASWRRVAVREPTLWRRIDLKSTDGSRARRNPSSPRAWRAMARAAVGRSAGKCESYAGSVDADFLAYLAASSPSLRSLHVTSFFHLPIKESAADMEIPYLPMLEHLMLSDEARRFYLYGPMGSMLRMKLERMVKDMYTPRWKRERQSIVD
ncbi:hypothetical protein HU200_055771 [Digitaria exilis]|uniref:F-box domain-containing protein n=1 Tax=Digitaria exilis TaxID=1010633 RepID=A0A835ANJ9_9POAL|nr:hypothetical protein HU200_055771 [Digitaria exilis]CAB3475991.1 unnamed protein product [Digitaria exilis]